MAGRPERQCIPLELEMLPLHRDAQRRAPAPRRRPARVRRAARVRVRLAALLTGSAGRALR